jgi:hypothetical protein
MSSYRAFSTANRPVAETFAYPATLIDERSSTHPRTGYRLFSSFIPLNVPSKSIVETSTREFIQITINDSLRICEIPKQYTKHTDIFSYIFSGLASRPTSAA